jgi:hypothetical protein
MFLKLLELEEGNDVFKGVDFGVVTTFGGGLKCRKLRKYLSFNSQVVLYRRRNRLDCVQCTLI